MLGKKLEGELIFLNFFFLGSNSLLIFIIFLRSINQRFLDAASSVQKTENREASEFLTEKANQKEKDPEKKLKRKNAMRNTEDEIDGPKKVDPKKSKIDISHSQCK
jgi:hypothetical protein